MSYRKLLNAGPVFGSVLSALALFLPPDLQLTAAEHAGHASHHDDHHHHEVAPGYQRSQASYTVPEVTLINQDGKPLSLRALLDTDRPVMCTGDHSTRPTPDSSANTGCWR